MQELVTAEAPLQPSVLRVDNRGVGLNVLDYGQGQPVLLVHGFPDSQYLWRHQVEPLVKAGYRVITADNRGFGASDAPGDVDAYKVELLVSDLLAVLDALELESVALVAHDWGVPPAWGLVDAWPERVRCFVTMAAGNPCAYVNGPMLQKERGWYTFFFLMDIAEVALTADDWAMCRSIVRDHPEFDHWRGDLSRPGRLTAGLNWYRANLRDLLLADWAPVSRVPTLGLFGENDYYLTEEQMSATEAYVTGDWAYELVADAGHWLMLDRPELVTDRLLAFLEKYSPARAR